MAQNNPSSNKQEIIQSIGKQLQDRRKARGLSIERLSETTKIRQMFLKALEEGRWDELPGDVYVRGFIGRVSEHLGLNKEELLAPYIKEIQRTVEQVKQEEPEPEGGDFPKRIVAAVGVGILILFGLIRFVTKDSPVRDINEPAPLNAPATGTTTTPSPSPAVTPLMPVNRSPAPSSASSVEHRLEVFSPLPLWLSVKTESKNFEGFISQNDTWTWRGNGQFRIRLGHTQEVFLHFDGQPVALEENQKRVYLPYEH